MFSKVCFVFGFKKRFSDNLTRLLRFFNAVFRKNAFLHRPSAFCRGRFLPKTSFLSLFSV